MPVGNVTNAPKVATAKPAARTTKPKPAAAPKATKSKPANTGRRVDVKA